MKWRCFAKNGGIPDKQSGLALLDSSLPPGKGMGKKWLTNPACVLSK